MKVNKIMAVLFLFLVLIFVLVYFIKKEPTVKIEVLGNPLLSRYDSGELIYARNIWDLQLFKNKIYIGTGNSSNIGPAVNSGPVPLISYDLQSGVFKEEFVVEDDQIDMIVLLDDSIYIPGHDPKESWELGNYYKIENGEWKKARNIPNGIHNYSMIMYKDRMFAGLGTEKGAEVAVSNDKGKSWDVKTIENNFRIHSFLIVDNILYAIGIMPGEKFISAYKKRFDKKITNGIYQYDYKKDVFITRDDLSYKVLFPDTKIDTSLSKKIVRPTNVNDKSIYIGSYIHNDHQHLPFGLYIAEKLDGKVEKVNKIELPEGFMPWDIIHRNDMTYVLLNKEINEEEYVTMIYASNDLERWERVLEFNYTTFSRSFEIVNDDFYFGLGCEIQNPQEWSEEELRKETGTILKVTKQ
ncbi:MAG: hypothetical protein PVH88_14540 [Ignavibacteria bacterium]|jgi:hypothetical protein